MKLLYSLHQFYPYYYTGTELLTLNIAKYVHKLGHTPRVLAYNPKTNVHQIEHISFEGIETVHFSEKSDFKRDLLINNPVLAPFIEKEIIEFKPDLIHITHLCRMGNVALLAKKLKIPYILTLTDFWTICPKATLLLDNGTNCSGPNQGTKCLLKCYRRFNADLVGRYKIIQTILNHAALITYASDSVVEMISQSIQINDKKLVKIQHGFNLNLSDKKEHKYPEHKKFVFAYIGSINKHKGAHIAIQAFIKMKHPNAILRIYGDVNDNPPYGTYIKKLAQSNKDIQFMGLYKKEETKKVFNSANAIIIPSIWRETYPFVGVTAQAYGIPIIASRIGGLPEIVKDLTNGLLFVPNDSSDLSEKMTRILNKNLYDHLSKHATYDQRIENEAFQYNKLYMSLL